MYFLKVFRWTCGSLVTSYRTYVVAGVLPNNLSLEVWQLGDVKQLDGLFRAHVLLAQIAGRGSPNFVDYILQAYAYVMQMWQVRYRPRHANLSRVSSSACSRTACKYNVDVNQQVSVSQSGNIVRELAKTSTQKDSDTGGKASAKGKGKKGKEEVSNVWAKGQGKEEVKKMSDVFFMLLLLLEGTVAIL